MVCSFLQCNVFVVTLLSDEPRQNQGRGLDDCKLHVLKAPRPSNSVTGRLKAALLFWFFYGLRCGGGYVSCQILK